MITSYKKIDYLFRTLEKFFTKTARNEYDVCFALMAILKTAEFINPEQSLSIKKLEAGLTKLEQEQLQKIPGNDGYQNIREQIKKTINKKTTGRLSIEEINKAENKNLALDKQIRLIAQYLNNC